MLQCLLGFFAFAYCDKNCAIITLIMQGTTEKENRKKSYFIRENKKVYAKNALLSSPACCVGLTGQKQSSESVLLGA